MIEYLKSPIYFSVAVALAITTYNIANSMLFSSEEFKLSKHLKNTLIMAVIVYFLLQYYYIPKRILSESFRTGQAPF